MTAARTIDQLVKCNDNQPISEPVRAVMAGEMDHMMPVDGDIDGLHFQPPGFSDDCALCCQVVATFIIVIAGICAAVWALKCMGLAQ